MTVGIVCTWIWGGVFFFCEGTRDCVVESEVLKVGQRKCFLLCALPSRGATRRSRHCGKTRPPARSGLSMRGEKSEPEAVCHKGARRGPVHAARRWPIRPLTAYGP